MGINRDLSYVEILFQDYKILKANKHDGGGRGGQVIDMMKSGHIKAVQESRIPKSTIFDKVIIKRITQKYTICKTIFQEEHGS